MNSCSSEKCKNFKLSTTTRQKLRKCNYEGILDNDPGSKITITQCVGNNGTKDITVLTKKVYLTEIVDKMFAKGNFSGQSIRKYL